MRHVDFSPLMRATVGFDRMMNLLDAVPSVDGNGVSYPPYNIEKTSDDGYRISMAVAGFGENDLDVTVRENSLTIAGKQEKTETSEGKFLHRGIATRAFERRFELADYIRVTGAKLENGMLHVELVREIPEAKKPRTIKIDALPADQAKEIEQKAA